MNVSAVRIPAVWINLFKLCSDATMLRLNFFNWSNINYDKETSKFTDRFTGRTSVWTDFQTGSNQRSRDAKLDEIGFNTFGDLLTELEVDPDKAFDNQLFIIAPNTAEGKLGPIKKPTAVTALTNNEEANIHQRTINGKVIGFHIQGSTSDDEIIAAECFDRVVSSLGDDTVILGENGSSGNWWSDRYTVEGSGHSNVFKLSAGTYVKGYSVTCNGNGSTPKIRTARFL